jgi:hypothetical protein
MRQGFRASTNFVQMKMFYVNISHMTQGVRVSTNFVQMKMFILAFRV